MSFSSEIKTELCSLTDLSPECYHAQVYGLVLFAHFTAQNLSIKTENKNIFDLYCDYAKNYIGCDISVNTTGSRKLIASVESKENKIKFFDKFGHSLNEASTRINHANFENEECLVAFLRGVFLSCGSVSDPEKTYHLEFVVPYLHLSSDLIKVLNEIGLYPKYVKRKGNHIVYFKDSESIEDFLAMIGAQNASLYLMNIKIEKDVKNKVNRKLNFELYNIAKTVSAAGTQVEAINYIMMTSGLGVLPEHLQRLAKLRIENPEASLSELQLLYGEEISKSGVKHRLDKIVEISDSLKAKKRED